MSHRFGYFAVWPCYTVRFHYEDMGLIALERHYTVSETTGTSFQNRLRFVPRRRQRGLAMKLWDSIKADEPGVSVESRTCMS